MKVNLNNKELDAIVFAHDRVLQLREIAMALNHNEEMRECSKMAIRLQKIITKINPKIKFKLASNLFTSYVRTV